jgi:hypothetical protein
MSDHLVEFFKRALIQEKFDPLASRHFAFLMLAAAAFFTSTCFSQRVPALEFRKLLVQVHG